MGGWFHCEQDFPAAARENYQKRRRRGTVHSKHTSGLTARVRDYVSRKPWDALGRADQKRIRVLLLHMRCLVTAVLHSPGRNDDIPLGPGAPVCDRRVSKAWESCLLQASDHLGSQVTAKNARRRGPSLQKRARSSASHRADDERGAGNRVLRRALRRRARWTRSRRASCWGAWKI